MHEKNVDGPSSDEGINLVEVNKDNWHECIDLPTSAVTQHVIQEATALGLAHVGLSVDPQYTRAIHVYRKAGFKATGRMDGHEEIYMYELP